MSTDETIRRLRLGDIRKLLRWRCGPELPDDDAGREYLYELLLPVSLGPEPVKIANVTEIWAPWMDAKERFQLVADIERTPAHVRKITAKALGERLRVTSKERSTLRLWTIAACDLTDEQRMAERKANECARSERRRRQAGKRLRAEYLAKNTINQSTPWKVHGMSRASWYRLPETDPRRETSQTGVKLTKGAVLLVSLSKRRGREGVAEERGQPLGLGITLGSSASGESESWARACGS